MDDAWTFSPGGTPKQATPSHEAETPHESRMPPPPPAPIVPTPVPTQSPRVVHPQAAPLPRPTNGMATASLVLGILGIFLPLLSILALIFGPVGISKANQGASGKGLAIAGLVLGIVGTLAMFYAASNPTT